VAFLDSNLSEMAPSAIAVVSRISYLASDVLVNVAGTNLASSFSPHFDKLYAFRPPKLFNVPNGADLGLRIPPISRDAPLVAITLDAERDVLTRLVPSLLTLASTPLVVNVAVNGDLSDILPLRTAVDFLIHSATVQQAHDNALLASRLARTERVIVLHAFQIHARGDVDEVDELKVKPFLEAPTKPGASQHHGNGDVTSNSLWSLVSVPLKEDQRMQQYRTAAWTTLALVNRPLLPLHYEGNRNAATAIISLGATIPSDSLPPGCVLFELSLVQPSPSVDLLTSLPAAVSHIICVEQIYGWPTKWTPLYLDLLALLQSIEPGHRPQLKSGVLAELPNSSREIHLGILGLIEDASSSNPHSRLTLGTVPSNAAEHRAKAPHVPKHEVAYIKALEHVFAERLEISNSPELVEIKGEVATRPEYALGRVENRLAERAELKAAVESLLRSNRETGVVSKSLQALLEKWLDVDPAAERDGRLENEIIRELNSHAIDHPTLQNIASLTHQFRSTSHWIIGSDAWSYDLGSSGLHHAIASGLNVNLLILDTTPYSARRAADPETRKKDIGLYAMNYGNVYVASVAIYSSYGHVLRTLIEADKFQGPSVVLAYLPFVSENDSALEVLKETKLAVDSGYWPLYRWNPSKANEPFSLDSEVIKANLQEFLDRQNHLSQLVASEPQLAAELVTSLGSKLNDARSQKASEAYEAMLGGLGGPPLLVLYASDGGTAEKYAKRLATRAKARGLTTRVQTMDSFPIDELKQEESVAFITSTAGQGEPPQNGRDTFKALNAAATRGETLFATLKYAVFGMGDSHYWPRPEDAHYYNKPGKDLDRRLEQLGGERMADLGLGDDQDADGPMTGYKAWEPLLWKALGVGEVEVTEAEPEPVTNEHIKIASNYLRGTIAEGLKDTSTGSLAPSDGQLTKFHGIYEQDDRDIRDERKARGLEPAYAFMIRVRMPGGVCTPAQWLDIDRISDVHGNGTFKLTTRQTFQFHGVIKKHLKPAIQAINRALLDTIAACGDVNR